MRLAVKIIFKVTEPEFFAAAQDEAHVSAKRNFELFDRAHRIDRRDRRTFIVCRAPAVNNSVIGKERFERVGDAPAFSGGDNVQMRQHVKFSLPFAQIGGDNVVIVIFHAVKSVFIQKIFSGT